MAEIRALRATDRDALYDICLRTGDAGKNASGLYRDPELIGHVYAGAYAALSPETCFVLEDAAGVGGYILGTPDTRGFEAACEEKWWPPLRARHADPADTETDPDARLRRLIHHPAKTPRRLADAYPAHLHIDLLPRLQRRGWGRKLIDTFRATMAARGVPACHLGVGLANANAIRFYRAYGFSEVARFGLPHEVVFFGMATM
jgi:ribosomal protein S18 acetylase RimI-like enzyme